MSAIMETMGKLTTSEAANRLGVSRRRINALINAGQLPARKNAITRSWEIDPDELAAFMANWERQVGRPRERDY